MWPRPAHLDPQLSPCFPPWLAFLGPPVPVAHVEASFEEWAEVDGGQCGFLGGQTGCQPRWLCLKLICFQLHLRCSVLGPAASKQPSLTDPPAEQGSPLPPGQTRALPGVWAMCWGRTAAPPAGPVSFSAKVQPQLATWAAYLLCLRNILGLLKGNVLSSELKWGMGFWNDRPCLGAQRPSI